MKTNTRGQACDSATGAPMSYITTNNWWKGAETYNLIWNSGGHPGENADAVRQWRAATAGTIHITGNASDAHAACGDGVIVSIKKGAALLWQKTIENGDYVGFSFDLTTSVVAGDEINFIINKRGDYYCDSTAFDPTIVYTSGAAQLHWLVNDQLGTPRMVVDQSGSLTVTDQNGNYVSGMTRHDYLPFGEELGAGVGGRTTGQGYGASDNVRQKFTSKERDNETGLDYSVHRFYSSVQGRFTSVDPTLQSINGLNPQTFNRYAYVLNNPLTFIDPFGLWELSYQEIWENGKYLRTEVRIAKTKKNDDANSLLKQLGYSAKSEEGGKLLGEISAQLKQGEQVDPTKLSGIVGREFSVYQEKYTEQVHYNLEHPYKPGTTPSGPRDADYADCSMTACRIAFPQRMQGYGLNGEDFDVGKASDMLGQSPPPKDGLRTGDVIRYGYEDKQHFVNVLITDDDGTTQTFSRTGARGPFESLSVNDPNITHSYGKISGQYRPPFK